MIDVVIAVVAGLGVAIAVLGAGAGLLVITSGLYSRFVVWRQQRALLRALASMPAFKNPDLPRKPFLADDREPLVQPFSPFVGQPWPVMDLQNEQQAKLRQEHQRKTAEIRNAAACKMQAEEEARRPVNTAARPYLYPENDPNCHPIPFSQFMATVAGSPKKDFDPFEGYEPEVHPEPMPSRHWNFWDENGNRRPEFSPDPPTPAPEPLPPCEPSYVEVSPSADHCISSGYDSSSSSSYDSGGSYGGDSGGGSFGGSD